jgi:lipopolysaccharide export system permease protein
VLPKIFDWYIFRHVLGGTLVVVLAIVLLMDLFALIDELRGHYTLADAAVYVVLTTPLRVYELLPFASFLGCLLALGNLANHGELMVLRVSGVSLTRLLFSLLLPLLLVVGVGVAVGEVWGPKLEEQAELYKTRTSSSSEAIQIQGGHWYREGNMYLRVAAISESGGLLDVRQYWRDDAGMLVRTVHAEHAEYVPGSDAHWVLHAVRETLLAPDRTLVRTRPEENWYGKVDPQMLSVRVLVAAPELSIRALRQQIDYMQREDLNARPYQVALYTKLLLPISILGFNFLALVIVLGPMRQIGLGSRLTLGVMIGLVFKYLQNLFAPMSAVYHLDPLVAVVIPIGICWLTAIIGARRFT